MPLIAIVATLIACLLPVTAAERSSASDGAADSLAGFARAPFRSAARTTAQAGRSAAGGLSEGPRLAAVYDTILQGRFDSARDQLARSCPPAPLPACDTLREVALWWEIQEDPGSTALDRRLEQAAERAIDSAEAWVEREPRSAEAHFYLAGAHAPLAQWRVLRGERFAAARDGKTIKDALERALELDPSLQDAWFGIGLYHYYADVAPGALKFLRMLLLLPGGDRGEGLQEMLRAREQGELLRGEADYQLHWIYLWYEHQPQRALDLLRGLDRRYDSNPLFLQRIAEVEHEYFSDHAASARSWQTLLDRATAGSVALPQLAATRARLGLAAELNEQAQYSRALALLDPLLRSRPTAPYGARALAGITRGDALAALGNRAAAIAAYNDAIAIAPDDDRDDLRTRARDAIDRLRSRR